MICPSCKKEIKFVWIYSQCRQKGTLKGNTVDNFGAVEEVLETMAVECPECSNEVEVEGA